MKVTLLIKGSSRNSLIIEPWGEEFDIKGKLVEVQFTSIRTANDCKIEADCSEDGFLRVENPSGFRPIVLIDGREDERPAFAFR